MFYPAYGNTALGYVSTQSEKMGQVLVNPVSIIPYSGIFSREKFFANSWHVRSNGNFGGKFFAVPRFHCKKRHPYLTRVTLSSSSSFIIRARMEGVMSGSFT